jgi:hypothetical protein
VARLSPPSSTAVVDVPDEQVEAFKAQGWTDEAGTAVDGAPRGNASVDDWRAYAVTQGLPVDAVADLKRDEIKQLLAE